MATNTMTHQHSPFMSMTVGDEVGENDGLEVRLQVSVVDEEPEKGNPVDGKPVDAVVGEGDIGGTRSGLFSSPREYRAKALYPPVLMRKKTRRGRGKQNEEGGTGLM